MEKKDFIEKLEIIEREYKEEQKKINEFNIFSALFNENSDEVLHSRFISYLLSPNSKHGMKNKFLELFVRNQLKISENDFVIDDSCVVYPNEENKSEKYDIDILILNKDKAIIVENKINAGDSNHSDIEEGKEEYRGQLDRYYTTITKGENKAGSKIQKEFTRKEAYVFYLTPDGRNPSAMSIEIILKNKKNTIWRCLNYRKEIKLWLEDCEKAVDGNLVLKDTITQYKRLIVKITNDVERAIKFKNLIAENLHLAVKYQEKIIKLDDFKHVKWHTIHEFWVGLKDKIQELGFYNVREFPTDEENSDDKFKKAINKIAHEDKGMPHGLTFEKNEMFFYAISNSKNELSYGVNKRDKKDNDWQKFEEINFIKDENIFKLVSTSDINKRNDFNNKEKYVDEMASLISRFADDKILLLWKTDPNFRWDNGGKEIYKKLQSNPEFKQSAEYKEYIERLRVEDYDFLQDFELLTDN